MLINSIALWQRGAPMATNGGDSSHFDWLACPWAPGTSASLPTYQSTLTCCQFLLVSAQSETTWKKNLMLHTLGRCRLYQGNLVCLFKLFCPSVKTCALELPIPVYGSSCGVLWEVWWGSQSGHVVWDRILLAVSRAPAWGHDMVPCLVVQKEHPGSLPSLYLCSAHTSWPHLLLWDMRLFTAPKLLSSGFHLKEKLGSEQQPTYWGNNLIKTKTPLLHRPVLSTY